MDRYCQRLGLGLSAAAGRERERFARLSASLDALSPLKVLGRGYSIARRADGGIVRSVQDTKPGDELSLRVTDGEISCRVQKNG